MPRASNVKQLRHKPMKFNAYSFTAKGEGRFPLSMLAWDMCMPHSTEQYIIALASHDGRRRVELIGFRPEGVELHLNHEKWAEFGWKIENIEQVPE